MNVGLQSIANVLLVVDNLDAVEAVRGRHDCEACDGYGCELIVGGVCRDGRGKDEFGCEGRRMVVVC